MADTIRDIQAKLKNNSSDGDQISAAVAYVPLFGWILPYLFKKDDPLCRFHGEQAMKLNGAIVAFYFAIWVLEHFPLTAILFGYDAVFHPLTRSLWLVGALGYMAISAVGAFKALSDEKWEIPYLMKYLDEAFDLLQSEKPGAKSRGRRGKSAGRRR